MNVPLSRRAFCSPTFACFLQTARCDGRTRHNEQCKRIVSEGLPFCHTHLSSEKGLRIGESAGRGRGLFATKPFEQWSIVCKFDGELIRDMDTRYPGSITGPYAIQTRGRFSDAACRRGIGAIINAPFVHETANCQLAYLDAPPHDPIVQCILPIRAGDELLTHYARDYDHRSYSKTFWSRSAAAAPRVCKDPDMVRAQQYAARVSSLDRGIAGKAALAAQRQANRRQQPPRARRASR